MKIGDTILDPMNERIKQSREWLMQNKLNAGLCFGFVACSLLMYATANDLKQIVFDSAVGINVSLVIYFLVVWLPERQKRARMRRNLQVQYDSFKEQCIMMFVSIVEKSSNRDIIIRLKDQTQFRTYFSEPSQTPGQTRRDVVLNGLNSDHLNRLAIEFEIFRDELRFTLNVIDVNHQEAFELLKRLSHALYQHQHATTDFDDVRSLAGFLWSLFAGWNIMVGVHDRDMVMEMIESI